MTIKKLRTAPAPAADPAADGEAVMDPVAPMPAAGGATIADRFKLDTTAPVAKKSGGAGATIAAVVGLLALAIAGLLTFTLYKHWEFLQAA